MTDRVLPNLPHQPTDVTHVAPDGKVYRMFKVESSHSECHRCAFEVTGSFGNGRALTVPCRAVGDICINQGSHSVFFQIEKPE